MLTMEHIFVYIAIQAVLCICRCQANLARRMDILELHVSQENFRIKSDILELRELILSMNSSESSNRQASADSTDVDAKIIEIDKKIESFIKEHSEKSSAFSRAISDEKAMIRKILDVTKELAASNAQSVLEIEQTIALNEAQIREFQNEMKEFKTNMETELGAVKNLTKLLDERIVNKDGTMVIQAFPKPAPCPDSWLRNEDTCYLVNKQDKLNWYGASILCHDLGGKLAEPDTETKMKFILGNIDISNVWIGATDEDQEGFWTWSSSNKPVGVLGWQPGQPNNLYGNQNCMEIGNSKLNDENCWEENAYVCEKPVSK